MDGVLGNADAELLANPGASYRQEVRRLRSEEQLRRSRPESRFMILRPAIAEAPRPQFYAVPKARNEALAPSVQ